MRDSIEKPLDVPFWERENWRDRPERSILGYCWPQTVRPGEVLDFMVSTYASGPYKAELVHITRGNLWPTLNMMKEKVIDAPFAGQYEGRYQESAPGSFVDIPIPSTLQSKSSFTVQTYVFPTLILNQQEPLRRYRDVHLGLEGMGIEELEQSIDEQTLVARWNEREQVGWSLFLDRSGRPSFKIAGKNGAPRSVNLESSLKPRRWYLVAATFDANENEIRVSSKTVKDRHPFDQVRAFQCKTTKITSECAPTQFGNIRLGATEGEARPGTHSKPAQVFNGKLDATRICRGVLSEAEIASMADTAPPPHLEEQVVGFWDFGKGIGSHKVHDLFRNQLHGRTINMPYRGVVGVRFCGETSDWTMNPEGYSACEFHDDQLQDAEWESDFSYIVPSDLPSGLYAAKLTHGEFVDHVPFFVAPESGKPTARVALLMPTLTYAAYSNIDEFIPLSIPKAELRDDGTRVLVKDHAIHPSIAGVPYREMAFLAKHYQFLGGGVYRLHNDGTNHWHAAQKCPNLTMKLAAGYTKLCMDTLLIDWLKEKQISVDIITDDLLDSEGVKLLNDYQVVLTGHHPEYCSSRMLDAIEQYVDGGGRWMYLGGNGYCWSTPYHPTVEGMAEVRKMWGGLMFPKGEFYDRQQRKNEFDGKMGGLWRESYRPEHQLVGVGLADAPYQTKSVPYRLTEASKGSRVSFIFAGVSDDLIGDFGLCGQGACGFEIDSANIALGTPSHAVIVAQSIEFERPWSFFMGGIERDEYTPRFPSPVGHMVFFETHSGGAVFSAGSMSFIGALSHNNYSNNVSTITENVLTRFLNPLKFELPAEFCPSVDS